VADVCSYVEEVYRLALSAERIGDGDQETQLADGIGAVVEDAPVDEVGEGAGVGVAEELGLEGVGFLVVGMRKGAKDGVATSKPLLVSHKPQDPMLHGDPHAVMIVHGGSELCGDGEVGYWRAWCGSIKVTIWFQRLQLPAVR